MTRFLRLFNANDKAEALSHACYEVRQGESLEQLFEVETDSFPIIPGAPFAYWVSEYVRSTFTHMPTIKSYGIEGAVGAQTSNNFRFLRLWWELEAGNNPAWTPYAKGGKYSKFYGAIDLVVKSNKNFYEIVSYANSAYPYLNGNARSLMHADIDNFGRPGITWTKSTTSPPSFRLLPIQASYSDTGPTANGDVDETVLLAMTTLMNSQPFKYLMTLSLGLAAEGRKHYEIGVVNKNPIPEIDSDNLSLFSRLALNSWSLKRALDTVVENSHAFYLPYALLERMHHFDINGTEEELANIQRAIDEAAFEIYGFSEADIDACLELSSAALEQTEDDDDEDFIVEQSEGLLSWCIGVALGRFDWRLATGEREPPPEPEPFDPLPAKSPGMLPDGAEPFHHHAGILVDDEGHQHDLPRLIEQVLETVDAPVSQDIRRWLRKEFFPFHLRQYSKSRRKAPIYWPLSTASGSYTLWIYYPELNSQTLFTAVNDFVEPKLNAVRDDLSALRNKGGGRSKQEEKALEKLEDLEQELADLRDTLLDIAPNYCPNQDDGVQITAAPLWSLFRHKPWQKVLKDTWKQLEKGDYDWAHLALNYWPDRVLRKCHEDRSLSIAHDVEDEFWEEVEVSVIRRGKDTGETKLEWQPKDLSEAQLQAVINQVRQERSL